MEQPHLVKTELSRLTGSWRRPLISWRSRGTPPNLRGWIPVAHIMSGYDSANSIKLVQILCQFLWACFYSTSNFKGTWIVPGLFRIGRRSGDVASVYRSTGPVERRPRAAAAGPA